MRDVWILLVLAAGDGPSDYGSRPLVHEFGTVRAAEDARAWFVSMAGGNIRATVIHDVRA